MVDIFAPATEQHDRNQGVSGVGTSEVCFEEMAAIRAPVAGDVGCRDRAVEPRPSGRVEIRWIVNCLHRKRFGLIGILTPGLRNIGFGDSRVN